MKISNIKIHNFRSIKDAEITVSEFNIFVGQNNSGKANMFEALEFFFNGYKGQIEDLIYKRENVEMYVSVEFSNVQDGLKNMLNEKNRSTISLKIGDSDKVTFVRSSTDVKKRKMYINGAEVSPGTGFETALNDFLPKFEYITTKQYYDSVAKYSKTTPMGVMLSDVLTTILQENQQYKDFQKNFSDLFESDKSEIRAEFENIGNQVKVYLEKQSIG